MDLQDAKYVSMLVLFGSTLLTTLMAMGLQRFVLHRGGNALSVTQRVISCLTSGIFLGELNTMPSFRFDHLVFSARNTAHTDSSELSRSGCSTVAWF